MTREQIEQYYRLVQTGPNSEAVAEFIEDVEYRRRFEQLTLLYEAISQEEMEKQKQEFAENMLKQIKESGEYEYFEEIGLQIEENIEFEDLPMLKETKAILAVLYRGYWASDDERTRIIEKQTNDIMKAEEIKRKKYNYKELFKK